MRNLMLIFCLFFITSCGKVECPAFPEKLITWVDVKKNDTLAYKSSNDTLSHIVIYNYKSEEYSFKKNCDCECTATAGFETQENKNGYKIIGNCSYFNDNNIILSYKFQSIEISDFFEFRYNFSNNQILDEAKIINYELNGNTISNVALIEKDNNKKIVKAYFTNKKGLIAFVDKNNIEWKLIE